MSVPQVASPSTKVHAHGHAQIRSQRSAPDEGTASLFDSLVDRSATTPQQAQGDPPAGAASSGQKSPVSQTAKPDIGTDQATPKPETDTAPALIAAAEAANGTQGPDEAAATAKAVVASLPDNVKPDTPKKADDDATAATPQADALVTPNPVQPQVTPPPAPVDVQKQPTTGDDATSPVAAPAASASAPTMAPPAPSATGSASAAVATTAPGTIPAQPDPVAPAILAAATAEKLRPFEAKGKPQADKPAAPPAGAAAGKAAAQTKPQAAPADDADQAVPPPAASPSDAKPADDKVAAKPDAQPRRERIDAADAKPTLLPIAPDASAAAGAQAASAATGTTPLHSATATLAAAATAQGTASAPQAAAVPMNGLAVEIAGRAHAGKNNFEIRLDPPELGRIEVKLSVDRQGQVTSHLIADRQDTLDLLRRDSTGLERALQDAGLKTAGDGLQFSLRDQSFNGRQSGDERSNASPVVAIDDTLPTAEAVSSGYTRYAGRIGGVDIRV